MSEDARLRFRVCKIVKKFDKVLRVIEDSTDAKKTARRMRKNLKGMLKEYKCKR